MLKHRIYIYIYQYYKFKIFEVKITKFITLARISVMKLRLQKSRFGRNLVKLARWNSATATELARFRRQLYFCLS